MPLNICSSVIFSFVPIAFPVCMMCTMTGILYTSSNSTDLLRSAFILLIAYSNAAKLLWYSSELLSASSCTSVDAQIDVWAEPIDVRHTASVSVSEIESM